MLVYMVKQEVEALCEPSISSKWAYRLRQSACITLEDLLEGMLNQGSV